MYKTYKCKDCNNSTTLCNSHYDNVYSTGDYLKCKNCDDNGNTEVTTWELINKNEIDYTQILRLGTKKVIHSHTPKKYKKWSIHGTGHRTTCYYKYAKW